MGSECFCLLTRISLATAQLEKPMGANATASGTKTQAAGVSGCILSTSMNGSQLGMSDV